MNHATCFRLLSATHFATSLLPLTVRLIPVLTEIGRLIVGFRRAELTPQAMAFQELRYHGDTHAKAPPPEFLGDLGARKVGPKDTVLVGIARRLRIDDLQEGLVDPGKEHQTALPATPFFRAR